MNENQDVVQAGKKPRAQLRLPQGSYVQADQWMEFLGYEQYCWWLKLHSHVNRRNDQVCENHIPYTLESLYKEYFKVSKATFYRKIKILWEVGLIDFREFKESERKSQKPVNIIVYEYPFNDAHYEYLELKKHRDWDRDYKSESKKAGKKGAEIQKQAKKEEEKDGLNSETVEESVDNSTIPVDKPVENSPVDNVDKHGLNSETVDGLNSETVTVSNLRPNHYSNKLLSSTNKSNHISNNKDQELVNKGVNKNQKNNLEKNLNQKQEYDPSMENIKASELKGDFFISVTDEFFTTFAVGRWNKRQWATLVTRLANEILKSEIELYNPKGYIYRCLENIAYRHDLKHGKIEARKPNNDLPFYDYWLEE